VRGSILFLLLILTQAGDPSARETADLISDRDPIKSFKAISALVDMSESRRGEVERELTRLPTFYREVLESELKARAALGSSFGRGARVNLNGAGKTVWTCFEELARTPGMRIDFQPWKDRLVDAPFDADFKDVWAIEAFVRLCERAHAITHTWVWPDDKLRVSSTGNGMGAPPAPRPWFFYRNIAVGLDLVKWRKIVDFTGRPDWVVRLAFRTVLSPETKAVKWTHVRLIEAIAEGGQALSLAQEEDTAMPGFESLESRSYQPFEIGLRLPEGVRKIARLRFCVTARIPAEIRRYEVDQFSAGRTVKTGDELYDIFVRPEEGLEPTSDYVSVRIRPKKTPHSQLAGLPFRVLYKFDRPGPGGSGYEFTGQGDEMMAQTGWCTLRDGPWFDGGKPRRPLKVEVEIPVGLRDRPVYVEFRDVPLGPVR